MSFIITLNNKKFKYKKSISIINIIKNICIEKLNELIAVYINKKIYDLYTIINFNATLELININNKESIEILLRSYSYILGYAIKKVFPNSYLLNNNILNKSFYYDIYIKDNNFKKNDISIIEKEMNNISLKKISIYEKKELYKDIKKKFKNFKEKYKFYLLNKVYKNNDFIYTIYSKNHIDFNKKINVYNTKFLNNFSLEKKIYQIWYGYKINKIVYRIYGNINLNNINDNYLKNNDHKKINLNKNLYYIFNESPGMIYWNNNGIIIFNQLKEYIRKILNINNYYEVKTPIIMEKFLWEKTGHINFYNKNIYNVYLDNKEYCIKPMNCPGHVKIFNLGIKSYKDLPYRISEFGNCHRNELSGSLNGLFRTKNFFQDDSHIFCSINQIELEISNSIKMMYEVYNIFNFKNIKIQLSTRPENKIGEDNIWNYSEKIIFNILKKNNIIFNINKGEGAFYGPKIEFILSDFLNRSWQCGTIQLDFFLSKNLNSTYIDNNNKKQYPVIIHKAILGSIERFIGIITENYYGLYPVWLSPIQVILINITKNQINYIIKLEKILILYNIRAKSDVRNETINYKIREHIKNKIPYIIICGDKEMIKNKISVRKINGENLKIISIKKFIKIILKEINSKK